MRTSFKALTYGAAAGWNAALKSSCLESLPAQDLKLKDSTSKTLIGNEDSLGSNLTETPRNLREESTHLLSLLDQELVRENPNSVLVWYLIYAIPDEASKQIALTKAKRFVNEYQLNANKPSEK